MSRFAVGIDLGTTNCALAFNNFDHPAKPTVLDIAQVVHAGEVRPLPLLPSFIYLPSDAELSPGALALPWSLSNEQAGNAQAVGTFARSQGASVPSRVVTSAKSWLSYAGVDRRAAILPWAAPQDVPRLSPLEASACYLAHLKAAWDSAHPDAALYEQDVVLTVPASFDAVARELTVEAAARVGLEHNLRLLEEPQAALYAWLADHADAWRTQLGVGDVILVCDIGGGTTDFSLIAVREEEGSLELTRIAVGDHILLGGDNMDLALAYTVRARLETEGTKIDDWQMRALTHACRLAKEALLEDAHLNEQPLVIPGRGSRLVGGTLKTTLSREQLEATLLEGFFPVVPANAKPAVPKRAGLTTLGLPYASDPAVTRHLAAFLARSTEHFPTSVLFNGGVTRSPVLRARLLEALTAWSAEAGVVAPKELLGAHPDFAVSRGAAYYAQARARGGMRIRGGTAQAYYVGVEQAGLAVPGVPTQVDALCIAPFGLEEGSEVELSEPFGLVVGEPVAFRFFGSNTRREDSVGTVAAPTELTELSPIEITLEGEAGRLAQVRLHARITEVGTLDLSAVEAGTANRWRLSFNVRVQ